MADALISLPASVTVEPGRGGLDRVVVATPAATAEVVLQGAHVTAWTPDGHDPVIWTSQRSAWAPGTPIRGGIPLCFPWFGPGPTSEAGLHGFARITDWTLVEAAEAGDDVVLTLALRDVDVVDRTAWPSPFAARLTITVGGSLTVAMSVTNTGEQSMTYQEALHTYLAVGDVRQVTVTGLEDQPFTDRLGVGDQPPAGRALSIIGETDRVYPQPGTITVSDPSLGRTISVTAGGSGNAVVWNPWVAKAAAMTDFGDDEWSQMLCVETCNAFDSAVTLNPGAAATMSAAFRVTRGAERS